MRAPASHLTGILAVALLAPVALFVTACSSEAAQLSVTLSSTFGASYTPGTTDADFVVTVQNLGPGNASGVVIHALMPTAFQYAVTNQINTQGASELAMAEGSGKRPNGRCSYRTKSRACSATLRKEGFT